MLPAKSRRLSLQVAIVYDWLNKIGGAEQVLTALSGLYPDADWYTSVWEPSRLPASQRWKVHVSWVNKIPYLRTHHELLPLFLPFIFESFALKKYELVISVGSAASKGVLTQPGTLHINYCLTPTRYLWSHQEGYLATLPKFFVPLASLSMHVLQQWDYVAAQRPDIMISISDCVKKRVKKYYNRESEVIYPPVNLDRFPLALSTSARVRGYYLIVSRLVPYKNIELAIKVFNQTNQTLIIIGTGSEAKKLRKLARPNIIFLGFIPDRDLPEFYRHAKAYLQCNEEDFGISMVEALASGTPVLAYAKGGASEIVTPATGVLYNELSEPSLKRAVAKLEVTKFSPSSCRKQAQKFAKTIWQQQILERIAKYVQDKS